VAWECASEGGVLGEKLDRCAEGAVVRSVNGNAVDGNGGEVSACVKTLC